MKCYPNVRDLPEVVDCAVITAAREAVEEIVLDCVKAGVGGAIIFASGYSETGKEERIAQQERLAAIARESGMRIVGPNCIGVVNATARFAASPSWTSRRSRNQPRMPSASSASPARLAWRWRKAWCEGCLCHMC